MRWVSVFLTFLLFFTSVQPEATKRTKALTALTIASALGWSGMQAHQQLYKRGIQSPFFNAFVPKNEKTRKRLRHALGWLAGILGAGALWSSQYPVKDEPRDRQGKAVASSSTYSRSQKLPEVVVHPDGSKQYSVFNTRLTPKIERIENGLEKLPANNAVRLIYEYIKLSPDEQVARGSLRHLKDEDISIKEDQIIDPKGGVCGWSTLALFFRRFANLPAEMQLKSDDELFRWFWQHHDQDRNKFCRAEKFHDGNGYHLLDDKSELMSKDFKLSESLNKRFYWTRLLDVTVFCKVFGIRGYYVFGHNADRISPLTPLDMPVSSEVPLIVRHVNGNHLQLVLPPDYRVAG